MKLWWMGWTFPINFEEQQVAEHWPDGVDAWRSGYGEGYTTWVGQVRAESADRAQEKILAAYGLLSNHVQWRWEPKEKPADWSPGSRFT